MLSITILIILIVFYIKKYNSHSYSSYLISQRIYQQNYNLNSIVCFLRILTQFLKEKILLFFFTLGEEKKQSIPKFQISGFAFILAVNSSFWDLYNHHSYTDRHH